MTHRLRQDMEIDKMAEDKGDARKRVPQCVDRGRLTDLVQMIPT